MSKGSSSISVPLSCGPLHCTSVGFFRIWASARVELFSNKSQEALQISSSLADLQKPNRSRTWRPLLVPRQDYKDLGVAQLFPVEPLKVNLPR